MTKFGIKIVLIDSYYNIVLFNAMNNPLIIFKLNTFKYYYKS